jgi:hypothetical protein
MKISFFLFRKKTHVAFIVCYLSDLGDRNTMDGFCSGTDIQNSMMAIDITKFDRHVCSASTIYI